MVVFLILQRCHEGAHAVEDRLIVQGIGQHCVCDCLRDLSLFGEIQFGHLAVKGIPFALPADLARVHEHQLVRDAPAEGAESSDCYFDNFLVVTAK